MYINSEATFNRIFKDTKFQTLHKNPTDGTSEVWIQDSNTSLAIYNLYNENEEP